MFMVLYWIVLFIVWIGITIVNYDSEKTYIKVMFIIVDCVFLFQAITTFNNIKQQESFDKDIWIYEAELKSGEIVDAAMCMTSDEKATCLIKINNHIKDFVVISYEKKGGR